MIVLERPVLDSDTVAEIREYLDAGRTGKGVIVFSFGRRRDIEAATKEGIVVLRAPIGPDELRDAAARPSNRVGGDSLPSDDAGNARDFSGPAAVRRFSPQQLANLVSDLSAFEIYSDRCANRDDDDAAMHGYLHRVTAEARALMELALKRLAEAEGLSY